MHTLQHNYLAKRWNMPGSQANIYLKSGLGITEKDSDIDQAVFIGSSSDYETRRFFISYENRYINAGDIEKNFSQHTQIGVAPYIGDYKDLHTWLMLRTHHDPTDDDKITVTPLIRFFKATALLEVGVSNKKDLLLNTIWRF